MERIFELDEYVYVVGENPFMNMIHDFKRNKIMHILDEMNTWGITIEDLIRIESEDKEN